MKSPFLSTIRLMKAFYNGGFPFCEIVNYEMDAKVTTESIHLCTRLVLNIGCLSNARLSARLALRRLFTKRGRVESGTTGDKSWYLNLGQPHANPTP